MHKFGVPDSNCKYTNLCSLFVVSATLSIFALFGKAGKEIISYRPTEQENAKELLAKGHKNPFIYQGEIIKHKRSLATNIKYFQPSKSGSASAEK